MAPEKLRNGARWAVGTLLLGAVLLPAHRLLDPETGGPGAALFRSAGQRYGWILLGGTLGFALLAFLVRLILRGERLRGALFRLAGALEALPSVPFALLLAAAGTGITAWFSRGVLGGLPPLLDPIPQLVHARYLGEARLAAPPLELPEFWSFQYMVQTPAGWVSQYPPGHAVVLAAGIVLGAAWLVGPLLVGGAAFFTALLADRLFARDRWLGRTGAALLALSPFLAAQAGGFMSHASVVALSAVTGWAAWKAGENRSAAWAATAGGAVGAMVLVRPLSGLVVGAVASVGPWLLGRRRTGGEGGGAGAGDRSPRAVPAALGGLAGAAPFLLLLGLYNRHFFGGPLTFGYVFAQGPGHGLGFHVDPWGGRYGPLEALGYAGTELRALSLELLQAPLPLVALIGLYLLVVRRLQPRDWVLAAWALCVPAAHLFYWHHDLVMGPRMLADGLVGWCLLVPVAARGLVLRAVRGRAGGDARAPGGDDEGGGEWGLVAETGVVAFLLAAVLGVGVFGPQRLREHRAAAERRGLAIDPPSVLPGDQPPLVFVHGSWEARLGARLAALGVREDSIRLTLRSGERCEIHHFLDRVEDEELEPGGMAAFLERTGVAGAGSVEERPDPGSTSESAPDQARTARCRREAEADAGGVIGLPPLVWRGDLPGLEKGEPMYVRDMGPERNRKLLEAYPSRAPMVLLPDGSGERLELVGYGRGMDRLWDAREGVSR